MQYWPSRTSKAKPKTYTLADGLNLEVEPLELKESECSSVSNMDSLLYPTLSVRDGRTLFSTHTGYINKIFKFNGVWYAGNAKGLYKLVANVWTAVYEYGDTNNSRLWDYAIFLDKLYFIDGTLELQQYDGTTRTAIAAAPDNSDFIAVHANRMFLARDTDNKLYASALRLPTDWTDTDEFVGTFTIEVETADGRKPQALSAYADHVILFKERSMHELYGEDSTNVAMRDPVSIGAISHRAVVITPKAMFFLAPDGFYQYLGGSFPRRVSNRVKTYMDQLNLTYGQQCVAGFDGRFIYLSIVTGANTTPNITLKFDTETERWWVEDYVATAFYLDGSTFYMVIGASIYTKGGVTDAGTAISWSWVSKPLSDNDEIHKKALHKMYLTADIETGSTVNVYYSPDSEGDASWSLVYTVTATGQLQDVRIPIIGQPSEWPRIKLSGTGKAKFHRLVREVSRRG